MEPNYDKFPVVKIDGNENVQVGWENISNLIEAKIDDGAKHIVVECYHGVNEKPLENILKTKFQDALIINSSSVYKTQEEIDAITFPDVTDDRIFGRITNLKIKDLFDDFKLEIARLKIEKTSGPVIVFGIGASVILEDPLLFIYVDMARWEIQMRMRKGEVSNIGTDNYILDVVRRYKRAFFVDWRICDAIKKETFAHWDFVIDANKEEEPKIIPKATLDKALGQTVSQPFRLVPFFDPGPWGGQWMREVIGLSKDEPNFAWGFDCVPEENSVLFQIGDETLEFPASNLVFFQTTSLLGEMVEKRFGAEFPIRFDFLDTMDGGNLSLQVHPSDEYIKAEFNMDYTQDESYYILDAEDDGIVYLGLKEGINPDEMIAALNDAQQPGNTFDADKYTATWPAKKHDHFLIPAGTVHCSAKNTMVLEISATPYIFTFKLWDWDRLGLDGLPRPINIERGSKNIKWDRDEKWVKENLIDQVEVLESGDGYKSEKTGLHESEFIETVRTWFSKKVTHHTNGNLNVLNLVQGKEAIVESPTNQFQPFIIHFAETFVVPAAVGEYTITPHGPSEGSECATIKAYVKNESK
ncbi:class I mannose-6-phosphate isomerase [Portibacter lacus]|uniref:Mannose-6-phosphate isomerase n=1 Tax=Portibacter lacus TaxID=1099794 RepID=A0AA37SU14_9BACT|nr:mannose-6-phosphate isomerase [Portibacter lacus]